MSSLNALANVVSFSLQSQASVVATSSIASISPISSAAALGGNPPNRVGLGDISNPFGISIPLIPLPTPTPIVHFTSSSSSAETSQTSSATSSSSSTTSASSTSSETSTSSSASTASAASASDTPVSPPATSADNTDTDGPQPTPTQTGGLPDTGIPMSSSSSSAASASQTGVIGEAQTPKSFFDNKPLSISVIVVASLIAVIFFIVIGTWAIRKRKRSNLEDLAVEFSSDNLVNPSGFGDAGSSFGHGSNDVEKGGLGRGGDVIDKMEAVGVSRHEGGYAVAAASAPQRGQTQRSMASLNAYGQHPYASASAAQDPYARRGYGQMTQGYGQAAQNMVYDQAIVAAPGQRYPQITTYAGPYAQAQPVIQTQTRLSPTTGSPARSRESYLPNPFENANPDAVLNAAVSYDLARSGPMPSQQFSLPRAQAMQRKPPPPFLTVNTDLSQPSQVGPPAPGSRGSAGSLSASPVRAAEAYNSARPSGDVLESPQEGKRSSLLNVPRSPKTPYGHSRNASDGRGQSAFTMSSFSSSMLGNARPPVAPPLPDEFGSSNGPFPDSPKVLKVVNL